VEAEEVAVKLFCSLFDIVSIREWGEGVARTHMRESLRVGRVVCGGGEVNRQ
jgi:hypothetical protein